MLAPRYSPWNRVLCYGLGAALITSAFYAVVVLLLNVARSLASHGAPLPVSDLERYALPVTVLSYPPVLGWLVYCRHFLDRRSVRSLGLRVPGVGQALTLGAVAGALAITWLFAAMWLCGSLVYGGLSPEAFELKAPQIGLSLLVYALLFGAVAFMEELSFRGYLLHNAAASLGLRGAVWAQALLFALVHLPNAVGAASDPSIGAAAWADAARAMPSLVLVGAIFALMWAKTGSLWPGIGFHFAWNFCLGCIFSLPVSGLQTFRLFDLQAVGSPWISGGSFGAEGSVLLLPILAGAWWMLSRLPDHPQATLDLSLLDPAHPATLTEAQLARLQEAPETETPSQSAPAAPADEPSPFPAVQPTTTEHNADSSTTVFSPLPTPPQVLESADELDSPRP
jgi:membrane protease YdiL (CAAX protease family)